MRGAGLLLSGFTKKKKKLPFSEHPITVHTVYRLKIPGSGKYLSSFDIKDHKIHNVLPPFHKTAVVMWFTHFSDKMSVFDFVVFSL